MVFEKIDDNISVLKGKWSSNIYYLDFGEKLLIDSGHPLEIEQNIAVLEKNGIKISEIEYLLTTHSHGDHVGAHSALKKLNNNIKIVSSANTNKYQSIRGRYNILKGAEDDFEEFEIDILAEDGFKIELENDTIVAYHSPGHTIDSIAYYLTQRKTMFSGDVVYNKVITQLDYYQDITVSIAEIISTYKRLNEFEIDIIYPGHGGALTNVKDNFMACLRKLRKFENEKEIAIINNFIPSVEHYIYKNPGITQNNITDFFMKNVMKFKDSPFFNSIDFGRFQIIMEKIISLMKFLNIIRFEEDKIFLTSEINSYIRN